MQLESRAHIPSVLVAQGHLRVVVVAEEAAKRRAVEVVGKYIAGEEGVRSAQVDAIVTVFEVPSAIGSVVFANGDSVGAEDRDA